VAISFVWSVLNQSHERRAAEIVREMMPHAALTVGSDLYPQVREYTRTSTAVVNAYLAPILSRYVAAVDEYSGTSVRNFRSATFSRTADWV
jgi:N-methylhydantoinase A